MFLNLKMPKRFANGGNGRNLDNIAKNQDLSSGSGKSIYYRSKIENTTDNESFKNLCNEINNIQDAVYFKKSLIKLNKNLNYHEILTEVMFSNGLVFTQKNLKSFLKLQK